MATLHSKVAVIAQLLLEYARIRADRDDEKMEAFLHIHEDNEAFMALAPVVDFLRLPKDKVDNLLSEYTDLMNQFGTKSAEAAAFLDKHRNNTKFVEVAEISRLVVEQGEKLRKK